MPNLALLRTPPEAARSVASDRESQQTASKAAEITMLPIRQKEAILRKNGAVIPAPPTRRHQFGERLWAHILSEAARSRQERDFEQAVNDWERAIEALFETWLAAHQ